MLKIEYRILSEPCVVWWAGFRSTTDRLQQAGWEIAAEESVYDMTIRLLLRNRDMRLYAMTGAEQFDFRRELHSGRGRIPEFHVVMTAPNIQVQRMASVGTFALEGFRQIDAKPQFQTDVEIKSIEDFKIFATPLVRTEELIVEPQDVAAMLEKIRQMQAPEQARIRAKERLAASREGLLHGEVPRQAFHAQILSIGDYLKAA